MNNEFGIYDDSYTLICNALKLYPSIEKTVVFGSRALGNYKKGSDIDLALFGNNIDQTIIAQLNNLMNEGLAIPYFVDILHYNSIQNKELLEHIDTFGKEIKLTNS